jgi:hypothetical protein
MEESKPKIKNIIVITLIILAVIITGVVGYFLKVRTLDDRGKAATTVKPIKVYFEPKTTTATNSLVEANIFFENNAGEEVTGATVVLKFPSEGLTFNRSRTVSSQTQANAACKQANFKLEGLLDSTDNGDGTVTITRFAPFTDPNFVAPSGKFCFGTVSFTVTNAAVANMAIEFENSTAWKIVGPNTTYSHTFGDATGTGTTLAIKTDGTNPVGSPTPTVTSTPTRQPVATPTAETTPTDEDEIETTLTPTPTETGTLPNTAFSPADTMLFLSAGVMLIVTAMYVYNNRYRSE